MAAAKIETIKLVTNGNGAVVKIPFLLPNETLPQPAYTVFQMLSDCKIIGTLM